MRARVSRRSARPAAALSRCLVAGVVACATLAGPRVAVAWRLDSDAIVGVPLSAGEVTRSVAPDLDVRAGVLLAPDGRALWARDKDSERAMASITKLMTTLLALETSNPDDLVTISKAAAGVDYATGLHAGEKRTVRELLELALVASSNDAAYALGEHVAGSMDGFVSRMNARAGTLGMTHTHFRNPHGLDQAGHYSSAADIALLLREALTHAEFRRIVALEFVRLPAHGKRGARRIEATDDLLGRYKGLIGGKTGFTDDARYSFAASAQRDGITLTAVVLGSKSDADRFRQAASLLDWGFAHVSRCDLTNATDTVGAVALTANPSRTVAVRHAEATCAASFDLDGEITSATTLATTVPLPVFQGEPLGETVFIQGDKKLTRVAVVAAESVASAEETLGSVPVADFIDRTVPARAAAARGLSVKPFNPTLPVKRRIDLDPEVTAPVAAGQRLGEVTYAQGGILIAKVPLVAAYAVDEPGLVAKVGTWFARGIRLLTGRPTMARLVVENG